MQLSKNWLLEWVNPEKNTSEICDQLTDAGLEVDSYSPVAAEFTGIVVAKIIAAEQHPNADKLKVCTVDDGSEKKQIVCGGKNARAGITVALATVGAVLPGDFKIKTAKLRGVESFGMLCSETELGLAETSNGIMELAEDASLGQSIRDYLDLNDDIIDIDLTPNRGDCLSVKGIARELGVLNRIAATEPVINAVEATHDETVPITIKAEQACPRYCSRIIKNIDTNAKTPLWMQEKLRRGGVKVISPVVDVTNYVCLELGQPMHAFALSAIDKQINVRFAKQGEALSLLDGQQVELDAETLVIADRTKSLAIAGVMGGADSAVTESTQDIVLESAFFEPVKMMGTARRYGVHTDSSHRFERGVDPDLTITAMQRATKLIIDICGGEPGSINEVVAEKYLPTANIIKLRRARIHQILGFSVSDENVEDILTRLGLQVSLQDAGWQVITPLHRFDLNLEVDLIEEIARIYGFHHIPSTIPVEQLNMLPKTESRVDTIELRQHFVNRGYHETMTYSFVDPKLQKLIYPEIESIALQNPIAEQLSVMRCSLIPSLVAAVAHNQHYHQQRIRLFEVGRGYQAGKGAINQQQHIAGVVNGDRFQESWANTKTAVDYYDVKSDIESLLPGATFEAAENDALHPGQSAKVVYHGDNIGYIGCLHPRIAQQLKIVGNTVLFELNLSQTVQNIVPRYQAIKKYPQIRRDLAIVVAEQVTFQQVYDIVHNSAGELLVDFGIFDVYRGEGIAANRKSMAIKMILQHPERTLVDEEVAQLIGVIVKQLTGSLNAELRE